MKKMIFKKLYLLIALATIFLCASVFIFFHIHYQPVQHEQKTDVPFSHPPISVAEPPPQEKKPDILLEPEIHIQKTDDSAFLFLMNAMQQKIDQEKYEEAIALLSEKIKEEGLYLSVVKPVTSLLIRQHHESVAIEILNVALLHYPDEVELRRYLATAQFQSGEITQAKQTLMADRPDINKYPDYYQLLAMLDLKLGLFKDAELLYARLLQQMPNDPNVYLGLGVSYHRQGKTSLAAYYYQQSLKCVSGQPWASQGFVIHQLQSMGYDL